MIVVNVTDVHLLVMLHFCHLTVVFLILEMVGLVERQVEEVGTPLVWLRCYRVAVHLAKEVLLGPIEGSCCRYCFVLLEWVDGGEALSLPLRHVCSRKVFQTNAKLLIVKSRVV